MPVVGADGTETWTLAVHVPLAGMVPPEKATDVAPATGTNVAAPHPDVEDVAGVATTICAGADGSGSVNPAALSGADDEFVIVKVSVEVPPATVELGANALEKVVWVLGSTMLATRAETPKSLL
jgi:hypothetical protein